MPNAGIPSDIGDGRFHDEANKNGGVIWGDVDRSMRPDFELLRSRYEPRDDRSVSDGRRIYLGSSDRGPVGVGGSNARSELLDRLSDSLSNELGRILE